MVRRGCMSANFEHFTEEQWQRAAELMVAIAKGDGMPDRDRAEYQRRYRARKKVKSGPDGAGGPAPARTPPEAGTKPSKEPADSTATTTRWRNPYNDGLPDWPELIARLTQHQRDAIIEKLPKTKRGT